MSSKSIQEAILGASDGAFTGVGLVLGLITGLTVAGLWGVALTTTVAGTASMSLGELQKDNSNGWRECLAMAVSWASLCILPVLTMWLTGAWWLVGVELAALGVGITVARDGKVTRWGALKTYGLMAGVALPTVLTALVA